MKKLLNKALNRKTIEEFKKAGKYPLIIVLDDVRSLNNLGSVFRTCDAFLTEGIYLCGITATPPHREISKTALGATESVHWQYAENTLNAVQLLKDKGYRVLAVEQTVNSCALQQFSISLHEKYALIFGHEIKGVEQAVI